MMRMDMKIMSKTLTARRVTGSYGSVNDLAFSGDGRMVIMAVSGRDNWNLNGTKLATGSIRLWDTGFRV